MGRKRWALLWLPLSLLAAERDPFQPVEDPCRTVQLSQWRYGGAAGDGAGWTGFLQDGVAGHCRQRRPVSAPERNAEAQPPHREQGQQHRLAAPAANPHRHALLRG